MKRQEIIGLNINIGSYLEALYHVMQYAQSRTSGYVCFANVHMIIEAHKHAEFKKLVNNSTFTFADGMPLVFALKKLNNIIQERIAGIDFMHDAIKECERKKLSVFIFGSTKLVLDSLMEALLKQYPDLLIGGSASPPFKELTESENMNYIHQINSSGANLILVSLGCPKQETWMSKYSNHIDGILLGVGAAFEIHANLKDRAPLWLQKIGLEWFFRFIQEPGRLGKRYFQTNSLFLLLFFKQLIFRKHR